MSNLGAYKVDRRKKNSIYKDTLKEYATFSMESGRHNLFFPGGTRNRRGDVEKRLKLGLLGCGLTAYLRNLERGRENADLFVVPATLSYGLVLEAKSLIEEHLREEGKNRFIRVRNDFSRPMRMLRFWRNLQSLHSRIHLHFCDPLDLFGNTVDDEGISRDARGRAVDRSKYVAVNGRSAASPQRDREYTRELGRAIAASFRRNNVVLSTHAAAFAAFSALRATYPEPDFYRFLRLAGSEWGVSRQDVLGRLEALLENLRRLESSGGIRLEETLPHGAEAVFESALSHFRSYHDRQVLRVEDGKVYSLDPKLLYYYRNRLDGYGLGD
jgi:glycerol-3-phosphate O-acyltransferase